MRAFVSFGDVNGGVAAGTLRSPNTGAPTLAHFEVVAEQEANATVASPL